MGSRRAKKKDMTKTGDGAKPNIQGAGMGQVPSRAVKAGGVGMSDAKGDKDKAKAQKKKKVALAHPVEALTGQVIDEALDLGLAGPIPITWRRFYSSAFSDETSPLGRGGWTHSLHQWIDVVRGKLTLRGSDGMNLALPDVAPEGKALLRGQHLEVARPEKDEWEIFDLKSRLTRAFKPLAAGGPAMLREIRDPWGNRVELVYASGRLITVRAFGRELRVTYDSSGRILRVEAWARGAAQQAVAYAYTQYGELARATDALGHAEHYAYDGLHRMVKVTIKTGVSFHYEYDDDLGRCVHTWGDGGIHDLELTYDIDARTTVAADEEVHLYTWDQAGELVKEATPDGEVVTEYEYDNDHLLLSEKNAAGEAWEFEYDERGNKTLARDPAGNETRWHYKNDRLVRRIAADGHATQVTYNGQGAPIQVTLPTGEIFKLGYDGAGRLAYLYADEKMIGSWSYDENHDLVKETNARGGSVTYTYDAMGRPLTRTDVLGRVVKVEYDALGRPIKFTYPDGTRKLLEYDALGNVTKVVDALGHATRMEYAGTGVLVRQTLPDGRVWRFTYDGKERLREIENPKKEKYGFEYDRAGRVVEERTFDKRTLKYQYSKASRLARVEHPDGTWREYAYDPLGNVLEEKSPHGPQKFKRDELGRLVEATVVEHSGKTVVAIERDAFGRVTKETQNGAALSFTHDAHGRRLSRELPAGETTKYAYDAAGGLARLEHDGHVVTFERDPLGREIRRRSGKVVEIDSAFDVRGRLEERVAKSIEREGEEVQRVLSERHFKYDPRGRLTEVDDARWGKTHYGYDEVGQLIEARRGKEHEVFYYDAAGSLSAAVEGLTARAMPWTVGEGDVLVATEHAEFAYDANRRRAKKVAREGGTTEYFWDVRDRLREVLLPSGERVLYTYDAFGRRVRKEIVPKPPAEGVAAVDPGRVRVVQFLWDGSSLAQEIDTDRGKRVFVHAPGSLVPILQQERGEILTYVVDHLGTPKELIDSSGKVAWAASHTAWGVVKETASDTGGGFDTPFRFLGQYHDDETGLCYTRFRYFEPETARWLSPDPLGIIGGPNLHAFDGAPTNEVDPLGLCTTANPPLPGKNAPSKGTGEDYDKAKGQGIYVLLDEDGEVRYVGRGDVPARKAAHLESDDEDTVDGDTTMSKSDLDQAAIWNNNLTKAQAKGMEQRLIDHFGGPKSMADDPDDTQLLNKINSFADTNDNAQNYRDAVSDADFQEALKRIAAAQKAQQGE